MVIAGKIMRKEIVNANCRRASIRASSSISNLLTKSDGDARYDPYPGTLSARRMPEASVAPGGLVPVVPDHIVLFKITAHGHADRRKEMTLEAFIQAKSLELVYNRVLHLRKT